MWNRLKVASCFTFETSAYGYQERNVDKTLAEVMAVEESMKNVREYETQNYIELGSKLGEAMFYFVKFQRFVEQLEKANPNLLIKRIESNMSKSKNKESAKKQQGKTLLKKHAATKNCFASVDNLLEKSSATDLMHEKDLLQDIFSEYNNSKCQYHEDSDASFDGDILEENTLKSLVCIPQSKNLPAIGKDPANSQNKISMQMVKLKRDLARKLPERVTTKATEKRQSLNRYNSNSLIGRRSECTHKQPLEILTYMLDRKVNNDAPYISNKKRGRNMLVTSSCEEHRRSRCMQVLRRPQGNKPFRSLPLLKSIKQNSDGQRHQVGKLSLSGANHNSTSKRTEVGKVKKNYISSIMLSIKSQRMHLFERINSNASKHNVNRSQFRTKTILRTYGQKSTMALADKV